MLVLLLKKERKKHSNFREHSKEKKKDNFPSVHYFFNNITYLTLHEKV